MDGSKKLPGWPAALILAVLGVAFYLPTLGNGYVFDDVVIVKHNPVVREHRYLEALLEPYWPELSGVYEGSSNWRPLASVSFVAERHVLGVTNPIIHHAVNALLHGLVVAALFPLGRRLVGGGWALAACALFAAHPAHTESVAPVVGRTDLLAALGVVVGLECFLRYRDGGRAAGRWLAGGAVAYAVGLGGKESAAPLLLLLPAGDWLLRGRPLRSLLGRPAIAYLPFLLVAVVYLVARVAVLGDAAFHQGHAVDYTLSQRLLFAARNAVVSLELLLVPTRFHHSITTLPASAPFTYPDPTGIGAVAYGFGGLVIALGWLALIRRAPRGVFLWLAMLLTWLPTSGIVPAAAGVSMRFLLLPTAFLTCAVALLLKTAEQARPRLASLLRSAVVVLVVLGAGLSVARCLQLKDNGTYFAAVAGEQPDCYPAHYSLGTWYAGLRPPDLVRAREHYEQAIRITGSTPYSVPARLGLAALLEYRERWSEALGHYERALQLHPGLANAADVLIRCAELAEFLGEPSRAAGHYRRFVEGFPHDPRADRARLRLDDLAPSDG